MEVAFYIKDMGIHRNKRYCRCCRMFVHISKVLSVLSTRQTYVSSSGKMFTTIRKNLRKQFVDRSIPFLVLFENL